MHHDNDGDERTDINHEPTKAHNARQRAEKQAHNDGLRQQTNKNNEARGQMDRQVPTQRRQSDTGSRPDWSTSPPTRRVKEEGIGLTPKNATPRPTTRSKTSGRFFNQLRHAPPTPLGKGHQRADPIERGWQNRSSVMGDRRAHGYHGGPRPLARTGLRRPRRWI